MSLRPSPACRILLKRPMEAPVYRRSGPIDPTGRRVDLQGARPTIPADGGAGAGTIDACPCRDRRHRARGDRRDRRCSRGSASGRPAPADPLIWQDSLQYQSLGNQPLLSHWVWAGARPPRHHRCSGRSAGNDADVRAASRPWCRSRRGARWRSSCAPARPLARAGCSPAASCSASPPPGRSRSGTARSCRRACR